VRNATELLVALAHAGVPTRQWAIIRVITSRTFRDQKKVYDTG
jgi:hypothetical protein